MEASSYLAQVEDEIKRAEAYLQNDGLSRQSAAQYPRRSTDRNEIPVRTDRKSITAFTSLPPPRRNQNEEK